MGNVTFLGVEGSGKTVLTMALVNAFRAHEAEGWRFRPETRGAFRFLAQVPDTIAGETLPHQTTALRQLAWSVLFRDEHQRTLDILDYPGEVYRLAFLEAADDPNPATFAERVAANKEEIEALLGHLMGSDQVFVLFNLADAADIANTPANLDAVWTTNACLDCLHRLPSHPRITLLLTQIDRYVSPDAPTLDPRTLVTRHLPLIAGNFPNLDVLAVSAIGSADSAFGVDNLLLRCLIDTPAAQHALEAIKIHRVQFKKALDAICCSPLNSTRLIALASAFKAWSAAVCEGNVSFVIRRLIATSDLDVTKADVQAFRRLWDALYGISSPTVAYEKLQNLDLPGMRGNEWKTRIQAALRRALIENVSGQDGQDVPSESLDKLLLFLTFGSFIVILLFVFLVSAI